MGQRSMFSDVYVSYWPTISQVLKTVGCNADYQILFIKGFRELFPNNTFPRLCNMKAHVLYIDVEM